MKAPTRISFTDAAGAVIGCLRDQCRLTDDEVEALLRVQLADEDKKRLVVGLRAAGLIDDDQTALVFYQFPLRGL